jgi:hypothetical protein
MIGILFWRIIKVKIRLWGVMEGCGAFCMFPVSTFRSSGEQRKLGMKWTWKGPGFEYFFLVGVSGKLCGKVLT